VGSPIYLIDNTDAKVRESKVRQSGYYSIDVLYPGSKYRIKLGDGEERQISAPFSYERPGAFYVKMDLRDSDIFVSENPKITSPKTAALGGTISVYLRSGEKALANQTINITTPLGQLEAVTDAGGMVQVQAAGYGNYTFAWKNISAATNVPAPEPVAKVVEKEEPVVIVQNVSPAINDTKKEQEQLFLGIGAAGVILFSALFLGVIVVGLIAYFMLSRQKPLAKKSRKTKD
jgi:hypothetical protein